MLHHFNKIVYRLWLIDQAMHLFISLSLDANEYDALPVSDLWIARNMNDELFGFVIDNDIQFDIAKKRLMRISAESPERGMMIGAVSLNDVMARFLLCLLKNRLNDKHQVTRQSLLKDVWEDHDLVASSQQLWKTVRNLKIKLVSIGLPQDFINTSGIYYSIGNYTVTPLFYRRIPSFF